MADQCLTAIGVETSAEAVGRLYADLLDGWLVDPVDAGATVPGAEVRAVPLWMRDEQTSAAIARAALELAGV
jgi:LPPG:FO 2-phospho-L-lactate transferase